MSEPLEVYVCVCVCGGGGAVNLEPRRLVNPTCFQFTLPSCVGIKKTHTSRTSLTNVSKVKDMVKVIEAIMSIIIYQA